MCCVCVCVCMHITTLVVTLTKATNVPIQPNVVKPRLGCLHLSVVLLGPVTQLMDTGVTIRSIVIKVDLCTHADD